MHYVLFFFVFRGGEGRHLKASCPFCRWDCWSCPLECLKVGLGLGSWVGHWDVFEHLEKSPTPEKRSDFKGRLRVAHGDLRASFHARRGKINRTTMNYLENLVQFVLVTLAKINHQENLVRFVLVTLPKVQISRYMGAGINIKHGSRSRAHTRSILHDPYPDPYPMILHDPYPWSIPLIRTPFSLKKDWCWP